MLFSLNVLCHFNSCSVPDEFMYNPVTRSYGEPHKRPEVQNSTVEFIASSDYMVNTPLIHITRTLLLCPLEGSVVFSKQRGKKKAHAKQILFIIIIIIFKPSGIFDVFVPFQLRPPQPAAYLFVLDVSHNAVEAGYLKYFCESLLENLDK